MLVEKKKLSRTGDNESEWSLHRQSNHTEDKSAYRFASFASDMHLKNASQHAFGTFEIVVRCPTFVMFSITVKGWATDSDPSNLKHHWPAVR